MAQTARPLVERGTRPNEVSCSYEVTASWREAPYERQRGQGVRLDPRQAAGVTHHPTNTPPGRLARRFLIPPDTDSRIAEGQPNLILDTGQPVEYIKT